MKESLLKAMSIGLLAVLATACGSGTGLEREGDGFRLERGNAEFTFSDDGRFEVDLRVFGVNLNTFNSGHMAAPTHLLVVTPTAEMRKVFVEKLCEKGGVDKASMVQVIAQDEDLANRLETLGKGQQPCMRLGGTTLRLESLEIDGRPLLAEDVKMSGSMPWDYRTFVLVDEVSEITCR